MRPLAAFFGNWIVLTILIVLLIAPLMHALVFILRCLVWVLKAFQALTVGAEMPCFWDECAALFLG